MGLYYFSVQTPVAYFITKQYFQGNFHVHVAEEFTPRNNSSSSNPQKLHLGYQEIFRSDDAGNDKLKALRTTLKRVANKKLRNQDIDQNQYDEIIAILQTISPRYCKPWIYVIPKKEIDQAKRATPVPIKLKPNPFSLEWVIEDLQEHEFEIIETEVLSSQVVPIAP